MNLPVLMTYSEIYICADTVFTDMSSISFCGIDRMSYIDSATNVGSHGFASTCSVYTQATNLSNLQAFDRFIALKIHCKT